MVFTSDAKRRSLKSWAAASLFLAWLERGWPPHYIWEHPSISTTRCRLPTPIDTSRLQSDWSYSNLSPFSSLVLESVLRLSYPSMLRVLRSSSAHHLARLCPYSCLIFAMNLPITIMGPWLSSWSKNSSSLILLVLRDDATRLLLRGW
jgi:hypothetical protein